MNGRTLRKITIWLCATLSFTTILVVLGRSSSESAPSITSSKPSGARLAAQVLESDGFRVRQDLNSSPQVAQQEVMVAFIKTDDPEEWMAHSQIGENFARKVGEGRSLILISIPEDFNRATNEISEPRQVRNAYNKLMFKVQTGRLRRQGGSFPFAYPSGAIHVWTDQEAPLVSFHTHGKGMIAYVADGMGFTNRFIDQADNAAFWATVVRTVAGSRANSQVVFTEASFGNVSDEGMISAIGGWARAAVWQGYLLFAVIAWTCAQRFGYPVSRRRRQAGVRDLMEAFALTLRRVRNPALAQSFVVDSLRRDLMRMASLPSTATDTQLESRLPKETMDDLILARGLPTSPGTWAAVSRLRESISTHASKIRS